MRVRDEIRLVRSDVVLDGMHGLRRWWFGVKNDWRLGRLGRR